MISCACHQAVVLVGGEGTRLRPITSRVPKPVAPLLERPMLAYLLEHLKHFGMERVVFSTGFLAEAIQAVIGDGSAFNLDVRYVVEGVPLGTAGAIKNAQSELDDGCFLAFNGDVLSEVDLTALVDFHRSRGALGTIFLTPVEDPRRYGMVELADDGSILEFLEKPSSDVEGGALINAGVYVLEPEVLEAVPPGRMYSIERGVFPGLASQGRLFGYAGRGYWRDIGTPDSYLEAHFDILQRTFETPLAGLLGESYLLVSREAIVENGARVVPPAYVGPGARVRAGAKVGPLAVIGRGCVIDERATIVESVLQEDVRVGAGSSVERTVVVRRASIGAGSQVRHAVIGEACRVGADNQLANGLCLYPEVVIPDGSMKFREIEERKSL
jgi:mannose-1-phosphate guanylyltransferase